MILLAIVTLYSFWTLILKIMVSVMTQMEIVVANVRVAIWLYADSKTENRVRKVQPVLLHIACRHLETQVTNFVVIRIVETICVLPVPVIRTVTKMTTV